MVKRRGKNEIITVSIFNFLRSFLVQTISCFTISIVHKNIFYPYPPSRGFLVDKLVENWWKVVERSQK